MDNVIKIIDALRAKGRNKIRIPQQYFRVEIKYKPSIDEIEFYATIFAPKVIEIGEDMFFGTPTLIFADNTYRHNISWVSDKDTETILMYINSIK